MENDPRFSGPHRDYFSDYAISNESTDGGVWKADLIKGDAKIATVNLVNLPTEICRFDPLDGVRFEEFSVHVAKLVKRDVEIAPLIDMDRFVGHLVMINTLKKNLFDVGRSGLVVDLGSGPHKLGSLSPEIADDLARRVAHLAILGRTAPSIRAVIQNADMET